MTAEDNMSSSNSSTADSHADEDGWQDVEPDVEDIKVKDFYSDATFPSAKAMLDYCAKTTGFDFQSTQRSLGLDFIESIKLVNFVRTEAQAGRQTTTIVDKSVFEDDKFLTPAMKDDALLYSLDDITTSEESDAKNEGTDQVALLTQQLELLESQFTAYREEVAKTLDERWNAGESVNESKTSYAEKLPIKTDSIDAEYFDSYSWKEIHQTMLQDTVRTNAYRDFIYGNKHLFAGKTVLDVGCGTGILSMFCAKAGAKTVIAVDNSDIIDKTRTIVKANHLEDTITCIRGKIEEIQLPDGIQKVDIIVSEWMGYCLLYEAMLDSVIYARDKYLKADGLMVPSHCTLHLAVLDDPEFMMDNFSFWQDVYGFDMNAMTEKIYEDVVVRSPEAKAIAGRTQDHLPFKILDLHTITVAELDFESSFTLKLDRYIDRLDGFCLWFDTIFLDSRVSSIPDSVMRGEVSNKTVVEGNVFFSTGPFSKTTHWSTSIFIIDHEDTDPKAVKTDQNIKGKITFNKDKARGLKIKLTWCDPNIPDERNRQKWFMR